MAIASVKPAISHAVANRATGSTTDGMPVVQRMSTPVAVPSIGMRGRGDFSSATHAATAHTIAAQPAGLSTRPRPHPSSASRLVVAAAIGSSATAISAKIGESQRKMPTSACAGVLGAGGRGGPGTGGRAVVGGSAASPTTGISVVAGSGTRLAAPGVARGAGVRRRHGETTSTSIGRRRAGDKSTAAAQTTCTAMYPIATGTSAAMADAPTGTTATTTMTARC